MALLADIFTQHKDGCAQAEAVVARLKLDHEAKASRVEFSSIFASQQHKEAAKCGGAPEPEDTVTTSTALEARQQEIFDKLNSLRNFSRSGGGFDGRAG